MRLVHKTFAQYRIFLEGTLLKRVLHIWLLVRAVCRGPKKGMRFGRDSRKRALVASHLCFTKISPQKKTVISKALGMKCAEVVRARLFYSIELQIPPSLSVINDHVF